MKRPELAPLSSWLRFTITPLHHPLQQSSLWVWPPVPHFRNEGLQSLRLFELLMRVEICHSATGEQTDRNKGDERDLSNKLRKGMQKNIMKSWLRRFDQKRHFTKQKHLCKTASYNHKGGCQGVAMELVKYSIFLFTMAASQPKDPTARSIQYSAPQIWFRSLLSASLWE